VGEASHQTLEKREDAASAREIRWGGRRATGDYRGSRTVGGDRKLTHLRSLLAKGANRKEIKEINTLKNWKKSREGIPY